MLKYLKIESEAGFFQHRIDGIYKMTLSLNANGRIYFHEKRSNLCIEEYGEGRKIYKSIKKSVAERLLNEAEEVLKGCVDESFVIMVLDASPDTITLIYDNGRKVCGYFYAENDDKNAAIEKLYNHIEIETGFEFSFEMNSIFEEIKPLIFDDLNADGYKRSKDWNGYVVYEPIYKKYVEIGIPSVVLVNDDEVRVSTLEESFEYLRFSVPSDEDDDE